MLLTLILVFILSALAAAASQSNEFQELLNRGQIRQHEVFNASYNEVQQQMSHLRTQLQAGRLPEYLSAIINRGESVELKSTMASSDSNHFGLLSVRGSAYAQELRLRFNPLPEKHYCFRFEMTVLTHLLDTDYRSLQHQQFDLPRLKPQDSAAPDFTCQSNFAGANSSLIKGEWWESSSLH